MHKFNTDIAQAFNIEFPHASTEVYPSNQPLDRVRGLAGEQPCLCIFDENTEKTCPVSGEVNAETAGETIREERLVFPPGEKYKTWSSVSSAAEKLLDMGAGRDTVLAAVGGGVVCDLAAFAASVYMRGMRLVLVPTTLLAMVDASIGGKTGIDFGGSKNILGTFYPAEEVIISTEFLSTLPEKEYMNGLAELIKHALLADSELYRLLREKQREVLERDPEVLRELIFRSLRIKAAYVEQDPTEKGIRGHLNLGHTFAHALESAGGFSGYTHGEAVAWGLAKAAAAGVEMGITEPAYAEEVTALLSSYGYVLEGVSDDPRSLIDGMKNDKKKRGGKVRFILQKRREETLYSQVPEDILLKVLRRG
ncbi:MAG: 3-dehydroquinate synthase [Spirochaetia bacterium]